MKTGIRVTFNDSDYAAEIYGSLVSVAVLEVVDASRFELTVAPIVSDGQSVFANLSEAFTVLKSEIHAI